VTTDPPASDDLLNEAERAATEALADLAALLRGGGRAGAEPDAISAAFSDNLLRLLPAGNLVLELRDEGIFRQGRPWWAQDLLARRVALALRGQGLQAVEVTTQASARALQALSLLLARDWTREPAGAMQELTARGGAAGISFDFSREVPEAVGGGLEPGVLLNLLRGQDGADQPQIAGPLQAIRAQLEQPRDLAGAVQGAGLEARHRLGAELALIEGGRDVSTELISRVVFEAMRLDPAGLQAADTFRLVVEHYEHLVANGEPQQAVELIRRPLSLIDARVVPLWPHRELLVAESAVLFDEAALQRVLSAANASEGDVDGWRQLLLLLGELVPAARIEALVSLMGGLSRVAFRQAIADGLVLKTGGDLSMLERLLNRVQGRGKGIVLLAIGRGEAPTLLEKVLARTDSADSTIRLDALVALRKHRSPRAQDIVRAAINDADLAVRIEALRYVTVYRDSPAAPVILARLQGLKTSDEDEAELKALGKAFALIMRQEGVLPLTRLAQDAASTRPGVATAAIAGLQVLGESGRAAIHGLTRTHPDLRPVVRSLGLES